MLKKLFLGVSLGIAMVGASPAIAETKFEEARPERVSVLSQEDEVSADADQAATAAPELEGAFSFQPLSKTEAASADASEEPSIASSDVVEAADADVSNTAAQAANDSFGASSDVTEAVSADADKGTVPQNAIVSASGLKRGSRAPLNAVRRPVAVIAGAKSIPRPSAEGLTPREVERLRSFDDFWLRDKEKDAGASTPQEKEPETPANVESQEETPEVDAESTLQQEDTTSPASTETSEPAEVEQREEETETDVEIKMQEETTPSTSTSSNEEGALEMQEETAPSDVEVLEDESGNDPLESIEEAEEGEEKPPELSVSGGFTGIGGEPQLEAAVGFVQGDFAFEATSQTPVGGGETAFGLEATLPLSEKTSLGLAAGDVFSEEGNTSLEATLSVQALPNLNVEVGILDESRTSSPQINAGAVLTISEGLELALSIDDIATEKVVDFETKFVRDRYELLARANNITGAPTFDIEASVKLTPIVTWGASLENIIEPVVGSSLEIKLDSYTLDFGVNDAFGDSNYDVQLKRTFRF